MLTQGTQQGIGHTPFLEEAHRLMGQRDTKEINRGLPIEMTDSTAASNFSLFIPY